MFHFSPNRSLTAGVLADLRVGESFPAALGLFGDQLDVGLSVEKLGRSSITFTYRVVGVDGVLRATGRVVTVTMDLDPSSETYLRAVPIPDDLRAAIEALTPA